MSQPAPDRAVVLPPRRTGAASALIRANRPPADGPDTVVGAQIPGPIAGPEQTPEPAPARPARPTGGGRPARRQATSKPAGKGQLSVLIDADVLARAKGALRLAAFYEDTDSLAQLVQNALEAEVKRLQDAHNGGQPVEPRTKNLRPGRRATN